MRVKCLAGGVALLLLLAANPLLGQAPGRYDSLSTAILRQLVEIRTTDSAGNTDLAARAAAQRLLDAGFPPADVRVIEATPGKFSLVARYRGRPNSRHKPILMLAHLDVVDAWPRDWSFDPWTFRELDGWYYGRGVEDNKAGAAILLTNFIRWKREGLTPSRDLIIALTGDEETRSASIQGLLARYRPLVDAEFALNTDAGGGELRDGRPVHFSVQTAEKQYQSYRLEVRNPGGHSSVPRSDNAIYQLSAALLRLARYQFPLELNETTRSEFRQAALTEPPELAADMRAVADSADTAAARRLSEAQPLYNALLHTTCVATRLQAGHADNALPQSAEATVNCRILPTDSPARVEARLREVVADTTVHLIPVPHVETGGASPLRPQIMDPVRRIVRQLWPGAVVIPEMSTGATDGTYVRGAGIPTYGVGALFKPTGEERAHGRDERVNVKAFHDAVEFWYRLVKELAG